MTGMDLARASGITMAQISRLRNGHQVWMKPEDLKKISQAIAKDSTSERFREIHARLLYARLLDECVEPGASLITITIHTKSKPKAVATKRPPVLTPAAQADMDTIAEHISKDKYILDLVHSTARLCRGQAVSQPDSE